MKLPKKSAKKPLSQGRPALENWLQLGQLRMEKCELEEAEAAFNEALERGKKQKDLRVVMEAIAGLIRLASEALDGDAIRRWDAELDALMKAYPQEVPPIVWHCKGTTAWYRNDSRAAQSYWHRYLNAVRSEAAPGKEAEGILKAWTALALMWRSRKPRRARSVVSSLLRRYPDPKWGGLHGISYLTLGHIFEKQGQLETAMEWYQKAHTSFLSVHHWYFYLYVLYGYARIHRLQQNYARANWYLDMLEKAAHGRYFAQLNREIAAERDLLEQDAVDLLIDGRAGLIKTRETGHVSLRKQYVLLHILEALSNAHGRPGADMERGLSKAEIIERVWKESYRPEAHDNKLYYNINRLRKLIEPDIKKPQYLLNWKEGYRLAPGLRVQFLGSRNGQAFGTENEQGGD